MISAFLAIVAFVFLLGGKVEGLFGNEGEVRLEVAEVGVKNVPARFTTVGYAESEQVASTEPRIEATVRNRGDQTAWIEEARVTVLDSVHIRTCINQGGGPEVPRTDPYEVELPDFPVLDRRVIKRDLHVEVQPGRGARPVLTLHNGWTEATNLYALRVQLVAGPGDHLLNLGRFVVGVPDPPDRGGQVFPESNELFHDISRPGETFSSSCFRHNLEGTHRLLSQPGERSAYVGAFSHIERASAWEHYASHGPAEVEVSELLDGPFAEAGIYAVEVAERTGDEAFAARVRARAVAWILRLGREALDEESAERAAEDAEMALSLQGSPAARRLLWRAEAAERAEG